ncbi:hypothetical protein D3C85_740960 [compost metagenome]
MAIILLQLLIHLAGHLWKACINTKAFQFRVKGTLWNTPLAPLTKPRIAIVFDILRAMPWNTDFHSTKITNDILWGVLRQGHFRRLKAVQPSINCLGLPSQITDRYSHPQ